MPSRVQKRISISAVVPNYNDAHMVGDAVAALATQSHPPEEIIVVDDGSTDDSRARLADLSRSFPTLRVVIIEHNGGAIRALQRGLAEACHDLVYFGASDDIVLSGLFETLAELLQENPEVGFASMEARLADTERSCVSLRPAALPSLRACTFTPAQTAQLFAHIDNFILTGAAVVRRQALIGIGGFDPALGAAADGVALRRIAFRHGFCFSPGLGVEWRIRSSGVSRSLAANPRASAEALAAALVSLHSDPSIPHWYPALFERRWRFAVARLCAMERPLDPQRLAALSGDSYWNRIAFRISSGIGGRVGEITALVWLVLSKRPTSIGRLLLTRLWRARRSWSALILDVKDAHEKELTGRR